MIFISKGILKSKVSNAYIRVAYRGQVYLLQGIEGELWKRGRFGFARTLNVAEERVILYLEELGVVELEREEQDTSKYRLLTRCICCATTKKYYPMFLRSDEKKLFTWICKAGLRLSMAELSYLMEYDIAPISSYLGEGNRQHLVEIIYTQDNILDGLLETQMEHASKRDATVRLVEQLLKKKYIMMM